MASLTSVSWKGKVLQSATTGVNAVTEYTITNYIEIPVPQGHPGVGKIHMALQKTSGGAIASTDLLYIYGRVAMAGTRVGFRESLSDASPLNLLEPFIGGTTAVAPIPVELYPWMGFSLQGTGTAVWTFTEDLVVLYS